MSLHSVIYNPSVFDPLVAKNNRANQRTKRHYKFSVSSVVVHTNDENGKPCQATKCLLSQPNTVGIIGGMSTLSTLVFLEKLVWWGSRRGNHCPPFVVCSDSTLRRKVPSDSLKTQSSFAPVVVESMKSKRAFLEDSGASCMVMPCHLSHLWHREISEGCSLPFLHVGECVAKELFEKKLRPLEVGSNVKIGVLATSDAVVTGIYQDKLERQGFEVVKPDKATMEHIVIPSVEALKSGDVKGARHLLQIAVQVLLMRAVNTVLIASDEMQGLLPHNDPLIQKCIDPMDSLARSAINWAKSKETVKI